VKGVPIERVKTGIPGLDEILYGGIPRRNVVLLSGGPGTGKTIMSQQYLWNGLQMGEPGVYVALEEHPVQVRINMAQFGWDVRPYEREGTFAIVDAFTGGIGEAAKRERYVVKDPTDVGLLIDVLKEAIRDVGAQRVVIDSVSTLYLTKPSVARSVVMMLKRVLSGLGTTSFLVSQVSVTERGFGGPGVEHAADGIIRFRRSISRGVLKRFVIVEKMRQTQHDTRMYEIEIIDGRGMVIKGPTIYRREDTVLPKHVVDKIIKAEEERRKELPIEEDFYEEAEE